MPVVNKEVNVDKPVDLRKATQLMEPEIFLRPWKKEDASQLAKVANNKNIWNNVRDSLPHPYTLKDAEEWIAHCRKQ